MRRIAVRGTLAIIVSLIAATPGIGRAGIVTNLRCGDVSGLNTALSKANESFPLPAVIKLNTNNVPSCKYTLSSGLPTVQSVVTIAGNGSTITTSSTGPFTIIVVGGNGQLALYQIAISGGSDVYGGGIINFGSVTMRSSRVAGNTAYGGEFGGDFGGGGIYSSGTLVLINTTVSDNTSSGLGGGIYNAGGYVEISGSRIVRNSAQYGGGGIFSKAPLVPPSNLCQVCPVPGLTLQNTEVAHNSASYVDGYGGGIAVDGVQTNDGSIGNSIQMTKGTLADNSVGGHGGGVYLSQPSIGSFIGVSVTGNRAADGGGIYDDGGQAVVAGSKFSRNTPNDCAPSESVIGCRG